MGNIASEARSIPGGKPIFVTCSWGGRGSFAASVLRRSGFRNVFNLLGGMNAWGALSFPIEKG